MYFWIINEWVDDAFDASDLIYERDELTVIPCPLFEF